MEEKRRGGGEEERGWGLLTLSVVCPVAIPLVGRVPRNSLLKNPHCVCIGPGVGIGGAGLGLVEAEHEAQSLGSIVEMLPTLTSCELASAGGEGGSAPLCVAGVHLCSG